MHKGCLLRDGMDVLKAVRASNNPVPALIVSARIQGLGHGADDYLLKPFKMAELFTRIRAVMDASLMLR